MSIYSPKQSLRKAILKKKPTIKQIDDFEKYLDKYLQQINVNESEEHNKNLLADFLQSTIAQNSNYYINTRSRSDLVIHTSEKSDSNVGVLFEVKSPINKSEMCSKDNLNKKALQELLLYYMDERVGRENFSLNHLIITNCYEFFIIDAQLFEKLFYNDKSFRTKYNKFKNNQLSFSTTDKFYSDIAKPAIDEIADKLDYTYINLKDKYSRSQLVNLFKFFSSENLLKLNLSNDSNSLNKQFYSELLHIIGLEEIVIGGKKIISRKKSGNRDKGSMLEDTISNLRAIDRLRDIKDRKRFGDNEEEQLFNVALELIIPWINRTLFLKLLEAQVVKYNNDKTSSFLNIDKIPDFDIYNSLFFEILAVPVNDRNSEIKELFNKVPYLNSSLFEPTKLERIAGFINILHNHSLPICPTTVLIDGIKGKKRSGDIPALQYLFEFLDAYDFGDVGNDEEVQDHKTLINASVLGLIFEKINGYKDGSFFTPGTITMYMCHDAVERIVIAKFNKLKKWNCKSITDIGNHITPTKENIDEANNIINSLRICDPSVGSGHFLVSMLNELIAIKNKLGILRDEDGRLLKHYTISVDNDELVVADIEGEFFEYHRNNPESLRVQKTLFEEKRIVIENCLFGVDLNPNSVKICQLRLWVELLKNTYYNVNGELETLPNIDINIKEGNSLLSKYSTNDSLKEILKTSKISIVEYRDAVNKYHNARSKFDKREVEQFIRQIKEKINTELSYKDKDIVILNNAKGELHNLLSVESLPFGDDTPLDVRKSKKEKQDKIKQTQIIIDKFQIIVDDKRNNVKYKNAFEWRFEFPEILNDEGVFIGFDCIIGNPPYIQLQANKGILADQLKTEKYETFARTGDIYCLFYERGVQLLCKGGIETYITSNKWMRAGYGEKLRDYLLNNNPLQLIDLGAGVFDSATVDTNILVLQKGANKKQLRAVVSSNKDFKNESFTPIQINKGDIWTVITPIEQNIKAKIEAVGTPLKDWDIEIYRGVLTGYNEAFIVDTVKRNDILANCLTDEERERTEALIKPILRGRDVKCYSAEWAGLWVVATFPSLHINIDDYPAIKNYLLSFGQRINQTGEKGCRKKTNNKWFEVQDTIAYYEELKKEKIVWKRVGSILRFCYDNTCSMVLDSTCFSTGDSVKYLVAVLNTKMGNYLLKDAPKTGTGDLLISVQALEPIYIPKLSELEQQPFIELVDEILDFKKANTKADTSLLEARIDKMVYKLYNLTYDEILAIDSKTTITREECEQ